MRNAEKDEIEMAAKRKRLLGAGFRLFSERGIDAVKLQDVADESGIGVATLYRYFSNKLALVLEIGTRKWEEYAEFLSELRARNHADEMTAAEELEFYFDFYILLYQEHKPLLRFNQSFNSFVRREGATAEQLRPYTDAIGRLAAFFHGIYERGRRDGTIRTEQSEEKMFASTAHIMLAVAVRYAEGVLYSAGREEDRTEEFQMLKRLLLSEYVTNGRQEQ